MAEADEQLAVDKTEASRIDAHNGHIERDLLHGEHLRGTPGQR